jgi:opacity protein-like surface antigen
MGVPTDSQLFDPRFAWKVDDVDKTHTIGGGLEATAFSRQLTYGVDYLFSETKGDIDYSGGEAALARAGSDLPYRKNRSRQHNITARGEFRFTDSFSMRASYRWAYFNWRDWAFDGLTPTGQSCSASSCVIGTGQKSESDQHHLVSWSLVYRFW